MKNTKAKSGSYRLNEFFNGKLKRHFEHRIAYAIYVKLNNI